jgi:hypothetical protein
MGIDRAIRADLITNKVSSIRAEASVLFSSVQDVVMLILTPPESDAEWIRRTAGNNLAKSPFYLATIVGAVVNHFYPL